MYKFCDVLKDLITESGMSLREIEKDSLVASSQLSRYLKSTMPSLKVANRLCNYFNCSLDYLFGLSDVKGVKANVNFDTSQFIERYLQVLKQNGISHYKFAQKYFISEACLRHWRKGEIPKLETLVIIAEKLGTSIDYLVGNV